MNCQTGVPLWMLIGLPGSGKSTWARHFSHQINPLQLISTDRIRAELFGHEAVQGPWMAVWQQVTQQMQQAALQTQQGALAGAIYDATNAQRKGRRTVLKAAQAAGFTRILAVWFDLPIAQCLIRNQQRSRQVPADIILSMARQLAGAPPHPEEGFDAVYRIGPNSN